MRRLMLFRHAKAEPAGNGPDFDRALAGRGVGDARKIGAYIEEHGLVPDFAAVSPARRALETWRAAIREFSAPEPVLDSRLYDASEETLLRIVHEIPAARKNAVIVGHNPGLERLAHRLAGRGDRRALRAMHEKFPTAALAVIDFEIEAWKRAAPGAGVLKIFVTPAILREK
jgi:phosphohistidine phosphatase